MAIESLSIAGVPDLSLQPPHIIPRVQVRKYGEQKKLFISAGLLPESPSEPGLPKSEHIVIPKVDHGESGWKEWVGKGAPYIPHRSAVCPSLISPMFYQQGPQPHPTKPSRNPQGHKGTGRYGKPGQEGGRPRPHRRQLMLHRGTLSPPGCQWEGPGAGVGPGPPQQLLQFQCECPGVPAAPPLCKVGTPPS